MSYTPHTALDIADMLDVLGLSKIEELFLQIPDKYKRVKGLAAAKQTPLETQRFIKSLSDKNTVYDTIFLGAGAYRHYIPPVVSAVVSNPRFVTAYTPYQPEMSQGILQAIFEYQSCICRLTGLDVSNASMYDGATAASEAVLMTVDGEGDVLISEGVNPDTAEVIATYLQGTDKRIVKIPLDKKGLTDKDYLCDYLKQSKAACMVLQQPNFFGNIEDGEGIGSVLKDSNVKYIMHNYPIALGLLKSPAECGADIATGEGQPLGMPLSFGGPYLGFIAVRAKLSRRMTGRIAGQTVDDKGRTAYVLTMQAREQHIRREKASSSICSNQALCALTAAIYLAAMGKQGFCEVARACVANAHYLAEVLQKAGLKLKYPDTEFFNEFVTIVDDADEILDKLKNNGILGGLKLNQSQILWCATEMNTKEEMDRVKALLM